MWINDCEEEELLYDWSDKNTNIAQKQEAFSVSMHGAWSSEISVGTGQREGPLDQLQQVEGAGQPWQGPVPKKLPHS